MSRLEIHLPDSVRAAAETRAADAGYATVDEYLRALIEADADTELSEEIEQELLKGRATPLKDVDEKTWDARRSQLRQADEP